MLFQVVVILIVIAFLMYVAAAFGSSLGVLLVNGILLFLVLYRGYFELQAGRANSYLVAAFLTLALLLIFGNYGAPFWLFTTFFVTAFCLAQIIQHLPLRMNKQRS